MLQRPCSPAMATPPPRPPLLGIVLALCLCCCAPRLRADEGRRRAPGGGYRVRAVAVDEGETQLRAELELEAAATGASAAAYGEDVRKLDVYARCGSWEPLLYAFDLPRSCCAAFGLLQ